MPRQVLPTEFGFLWLKYELERRGFRTLTELERTAFHRMMNSKQSRPIEGREEGFVFYARGLAVWVWTTWLADKRRARDIDAGWIVITKAEGGKGLYFSYPLHRTENFLLNLFRQAWIARFRIMKRPHCQACNEYMEIVPGPDLKERYWRCDLSDRHGGGGYRARRWDIVGLPAKAQTYVDGLRKRRRAENAKVIKAGRQPHQAMLDRARRRTGKV
jgi:hypothetical protein